MRREPLVVAEHITNFLGLGWTYMRYASGRACWVHEKSGLVVRIQKTLAF